MSKSQDTKSFMLRVDAAAMEALEAWAALEKPAPAGTGTENAVPEGTCPAADKAKSEAKNETQRSNR